MWHEYRQNENLKVFDVTKRKLFPPVFYSFYNNRDIREALVPRWKCLYKNNIFCCAMFQITSINMASVATHNDTFWHYIACDMMCFFFQTHSKGFQIFSKVVQNQSILHCVLYVLVVIWYLLWYIIPLLSLSIIVFILITFVWTYRNNTHLIKIVSSQSFSDPHSIENTTFVLNIYSTS